MLLLFKSSAHQSGPDLVPTTSLHSPSVRQARLRASSFGRVDSDTDGACRTTSIANRRNSEVSLVQTPTTVQPQLPPRKLASRVRPIRLSSALPRPISKSRPWGPAAWILAYFFFNMGLTLYNKAILVHFPYPYTMTALHTFCGTVGCVWARRVGYYVSPRTFAKSRTSLIQSQLCRPQHT